MPDAVSRPAVVFSPVQSTETPSRWARWSSRRVGHSGRRGVAFNGIADRTRRNVGAALRARAETELTGGPARGLSATCSACPSRAGSLSPLAT